MDGVKKTINQFAQLQKRRKPDEKSPPDKFYFNGHIEDLTEWEKLGTGDLLNSPDVANSDLIGALSNNIIPEYALLAAVLYKAITDAVCRAPAAVMADADAWIREISDTFLSCSYICDAFKIPQNKVIALVDSVNDFKLKNECSEWFQQVNLIEFCTGKVVKRIKVKSNFTRRPHIPFGVKRALTNSRETMREASIGPTLKFIDDFPTEGLSLRLKEKPPPMPIIKHGRGLKLFTLSNAGISSLEEQAEIRRVSVVNQRTRGRKSKSLSQRGPLTQSATPIPDSPGL